LNLTQILVANNVVQDATGLGTQVATYWFAPAIGPVKIIVDATETRNGYEWDFKSKNF
jgi:hypothetical protein